MAGNAQIAFHNLPGGIIRIGSRALTILDADKSNHWTWIPDNEPQSWFQENALCHGVKHLSLLGQIQTNLLLRDTNYAVYFVFRKDDNNGFNTIKNVGFSGYVGEYNIDEVLNSEVHLKGIVNEIANKIDNGDNGNDKVVYLSSRISGEPRSNEERPSERNDGWMEVKMGTYQVGNDDGVTLYMSLGKYREKEMKGLIVQGMELRPITLNSSS